MEEDADDFQPGLFEDGWARTAEPEAAASEHLHVTGLLQGIEASGGSVFRPLQPGVDPPEVLSEGRQGAGDPFLAAGAA